MGPPDTPYAGGAFNIELQIPPRYPFVPPKARFLTPIYHPNIDDGGRICLDTLKGGWKAALNIGILLTMIRLLMASPNPDDGLMPEIVRGGTRSRRVAWLTRSTPADPPVH